MKLTITIDMDSAAFGETIDERGAEAARILAELSRYVAEVGLGGGFQRWIRDANGNTIGRASVNSR